MKSMLSQFITPVFSRPPREGFFLLFLFTITIIYLSIWQLFPTFLDPDAFYHAKLAALTWESGYVASFPYLPESIVTAYWTDQHWLYHLLLAPFVTYFDPFLAAKAMTVILGVAYLLVFYKILSKIIKNPHIAFWWSLLLLTAGPFIFRLSLVKAQPFALIFLLLGIYFFKKRKWAMLGLIQFFYILSHGSFLLLPALIVWLLLFDLFFARKIFFEKRLTSLLSIAALMVGIVAGVIIQPTFPDSIIFYWYQIVEIGLVGVDALTMTALEWRPQTMISFFKSLGVVSLFIASSFVIVLFNIKRVSKNSWRWLWLIIPLFILSLKSIRNIEFFTPFLIIWMAVIFKELFPYDSFKKFINKLSPQPAATLFLGGILSISIILWVTFPLVNYFNLQKKAFTHDEFQHEIELIELENSETSMVINTRWDIFPMLFYHSNNSIFLTGLDPAFLYLKNPNLYKALVELRDSGNADNLLSRMEEKYDTIYIVYFEPRDKERVSIYTKSYKLDAIYNDGEVYIYKVDFNL